MEPILSPKMLLAIELAADLFRTHYREISGLPYVTHLYGVCSILQEVTDDREVHIAGLMHDVLEDIPTDRYSAEQLEHDFGERVRSIVETVSHDTPRYGKRRARELYLAQIESGGLEACLVSGADLLHNSTDIIQWFHKDPKKTRDILGGDRVVMRRWFYPARYQIIATRLGADHPLTKRLGSVMDDLESVHRMIA